MPVTEEFQRLLNESDEPSLVALLPLARTARAAIWLAKHDRRLLLLFLLVWPAYLLAALWWAWGFFREARSPSQVDT